MHKFDLLILLSESNQGINFRLREQQMLNPNWWSIRTSVIESKWLNFYLN